MATSCRGIQYIVLASLLLIVVTSVAPLYVTESQYEYKLLRILLYKQLDFNPRSSPETVVVWSSNSKYIAVCSFDIGIEMFELRNNSMVKLWYRGRPYFGPCVFSPDSKYIVVAYYSNNWRGITLLDVKTGKEAYLRYLWKLKKMGFPQLVTWIDRTSMLIVFLEVRTESWGYYSSWSEPVIHTYIANIVNNEIVVREVKLPDFVNLEMTIKDFIEKEREEMVKAVKNGSISSFQIKLYRFDSWKAVEYTWT